MRTKHRITEIDIAKAIGILCVFIGHRTSGVLHNYVYLFHMPLFLILSGCMIREEKVPGLRKFFSDNKLIASYLVYSIIFVMFNLLRNQNFNSFLSDVGNSFTLFGIHTLWFLSGLWLSKIIIRFLFIINNRWIRDAIVALFYIVCYWLCALLIQLEYNGFAEKMLKSLSWSLVRTGVILIFVYLGFKLKKYIFSSISYFKNHLMIALLVMIVAGAVLIPFSLFEVLDYHLLINGLFILNIFYGLVGTIFILSLSTIITLIFQRFIKPGVFIGKNSIHFMASEFFGFSLIFILNKLLGSYGYVKYIEFILYFMLLSLCIWIVAPLVDKLINFVSKVIELIAIKLFKLKSLNDK